VFSVLQSDEFTENSDGHCNNHKTKQMFAEYSLSRDQRNVSRTDSNEPVTLLIGGEQHHHLLSDVGCGIENARATLQATGDVGSAGARYANLHA
jgi:hypothetical protein